MNFLIRKLKLLMEDLGLSQADVARKTGTKISYVSNLWNARKSMSDQRIIDFLIKGADLKPSEAAKRLQMWKVEEAVSLFPDLAKKIAIDDLPLAACLSVPIARTYDELDDYIVGNRDEIPTYPVYTEDLTGAPDDYFAVRLFPELNPFVGPTNSYRPGMIVVFHKTDHLVNKNVVYLFRFYEEFSLGRITSANGSYRISECAKSFPEIPNTSPSFRIYGYVEVVTNTNP